MLGSFKCGSGLLLQGVEVYDYNAGLEPNTGSRDRLRDSMPASGDFGPYTISEFSAFWVPCRFYVEFFGF